MVFTLSVRVDIFWVAMGNDGVGLRTSRIEAAYMGRVCDLDFKSMTSL